jgi:hypothetical protein
MSKLVLFLLFSAFLLSSLFPCQALAQSLNPRITNGNEDNNSRGIELSIKEANAVSVATNTSGPTNAIDFIPTAFSPKTPCEGEEIKVWFNTNGPLFDANTKFQIRFTYDDGYVNRYMDVPAILSGKDELTARVPEKLISTVGNQDIYLGVVTNNPSAVSINKALKMYVYNKPSFKLTAEKYSVQHGESFYLSTNPSGMPPFKITLTNGDEVQYSKTYNIENETQFQVKTFESGCGVIQNPANTPITVHVQPSLLFKKSSDNESPEIYCEGQTVKIPLLTSGVGVQTSYVLQINTYSNKKITVPARLVGEHLEFVVPENRSQDPDLDYGRMSGIRVVSSNPSLTSPYFYVHFQGPPTMEIGPDSPTSVPTPSMIWMNYKLGGGGPFKLVMEDGSTFDNESEYYSKQHFIRQDTNFRIAKLSNSCFSNSNLPSFRLLVLDPASTTPSIFAKVNKTNYCAGDSVEVEVFVHGKFEEGNQFTLSNTNHQQVSISLTPDFTRSNTYKIKLPENSYDQDLQLTSTLPRLVSYPFRVYFTAPPTKPSISPEGTKENPVRMYMGSYPYAYISTTKYSPVIYSLDGKESMAITDHNGNYAAHLALANHTTSEFKLKSVTNECGAWNGEITSYYYGIGYKIILDRNIYPIWNCAGSEAEVRMSFEDGQPQKGTKFTLQISETGSPNSYTDLTTVTDGRIIRFETPNLKTGSYYIRIHSSDNIYSDASTFLLGQKPTAELTTNYPVQGDSVATVDHGSQVYLSAYITGNEPFNIMYSDGTVRFVDANHDSYQPYITNSQTFTISKIWNSCGYGTTNGQVRVSIKPILELSRYPINADPTICPGQKVELSYALKGANLSAKDYIVFYLNSNKSKPIELDSVNQLSGRIQFTIPTNLVGEFFSVSAKIKSFQVEKFVNFQLYATPDITLFGNNTITAGEASILFIRSNSRFASNSIFKLSDGTSFEIDAAYPQAVAEVKVAPSATTTYTIKATQNECGSSRVSGSATVTVLPKLAQWLSFDHIEGLNRYNVCNSDTIRVRFYQFGSQNFSAGYEVQLSDSTGNNFVSLPTSGSYPSLLAAIPNDIKSSIFYRIRVISKDPQVSGSTFPNRFPIGEKARARVLTPSVYFQAGQSIEAVVQLEGSSPFSYHFGDANFSRYRSTSKYSDTIRLTPITPSVTYKIMQLSNVCGAGIVDEPSSFKIELITGIEPLTENISFGPNPTSSLLFVRFDKSSPRDLEIIDASGRIALKKKVTGKEVNLDLSSMPAGVYLLRMRKNRTETIHRIVKY